MSNRYTPNKPAWRQAKMASMGALKAVAADMAVLQAGAFSASIAKWIRRENMVSRTAKITTDARATPAFPYCTEQNTMPISINITKMLASIVFHRWLPHASNTADVWLLIRT